MTIILIERKSRRINLISGPGGKGINEEQGQNLKEAHVHVNKEELEAVREI